MKSFVRYMGSTLFVISLLLLFCLPACAQSGVVLYEHINFTGYPLTLTSDTPNLKDLGFNDKASSIEVPGGYVATFYSHINYGGESFTMYGPMHATNLKGGHWNDVISSVKVSRTNGPYVPANRGSELQWASPPLQPKEPREPHEPRNPGNKW